MARYNKPKTTPQVQPVLATAPVATLVTGNQAPAFERGTLSELFLLGVSNFVGQDTFYDKAAKRDNRYIELIQAAVREDHLWVIRFLRWLRQDANMRTAAIIGAVEAVREMIKLKIPGGRVAIDHVLQRPDEPGEMLAYWFNHYPGKQIPKPIKRGVADAVARLYTERNTIKYDGTGKQGVFRFGDVLELVHASPASLYQRDLFPYLVTRGKKRDTVYTTKAGAVYNNVIPDGLPMLIANQALRNQARTTPQLLLNTTRLRAAGMTWEIAKSLAGDKVSEKDFWEAIVPEMGYMALLRNLRNIEQAMVSGDTKEWIVNKLKDPAEVARSRQLPMRFLSAYRNVTSDTWKSPLARALDLSLSSIPELPGRTLVLIDTSGSMDTAFSKDAQLRFWDAAVMFGLALASRQREAGHQVDVVSYSDHTMVFPEQKGETVLQGIERWRSTGYFIGRGTATQRSVQAHYREHDRVVILTDEQADFHGYRDVTANVPANKMVISFNLAGEKPAHMASGPFRISVGGLTDAAFTLIPALERGAKQEWPF